MNDSKGLRLIADTPEELRPREKALRLGLKALSNTELMALVFSTGIKGKGVMALCDDILNSYKWHLSSIASTSASDFIKANKGIGPAKALTFLAGIELGMRAAADAITVERKQIGSSQMAYEYMKPHLSGLDHEQFWILLLNNSLLPVKEVWDEALTGLARKARKQGIRVVMIKPGQSIREGDMVITCIQPGNMEIKSENAESRRESAVPGTGNEGLESGNEASMVLAVQYGPFDLLLTGDVEGEGENQLTKQLEERYPDCTWDILKVAHHGSKNSSTEEFLRLVRPAYALISAGQENRYGHPHQETIERLADVGSKIYSTQENGAIIVEVENGEILKMERWKR